MQGWPLPTIPETEISLFGEFRSRRIWLPPRWQPCLSSQRTFIWKILNLSYNKVLFGESSYKIYIRLYSWKKAKYSKKKAGIWRHKFNFWLYCFLPLNLLLCQMEISNLQLLWGLKENIRLLIPKIFVKYHIYWISFWVKWKNLTYSYCKD